MADAIKITGLEELSAKLHEMELDIGVKTLRSACMSAADEFLNELQNTAPIGHWDKIIKTKKGAKVKHTPGFLLSRLKKRSFANKSGGTGGRQSWNKGDVVKVSTGAWRVPYIGHVEMGTVNMAANPFMRRAAVSRQEAVVGKVVSGLRSRIKRYEKKMSKL